MSQNHEKTGIEKVILEKKDSNREVLIHGVPVNLSKQAVITYFSPKYSLTEPEITFFVAQCKLLQLNPFLREIYIVKPGENSAAYYVIAYQSYLAMANQHPGYRGLKAGLIVIRDNSLEHTIGEFYLPTDKIVGGWCNVLKNGQEDFEFEMSLQEAEAGKYSITKNADGTTTKTYQNHSRWNPQLAQGQMMLKSTISRALRLALASTYMNTYSDSDNFSQSDFNQNNSEPKSKIHFSDQTNTGSITELITGSKSPIKTINLEPKHSITESGGNEDENVPF